MAAGKTKLTPAKTPGGKQALKFIGTLTPNTAKTPIQIFKNSLIKLMESHKYDSYKFNKAPHSSSGYKEAKEKYNQLPKGTVVTFSKEDFPICSFGSDMTQKIKQGNNFYEVLINKMEKQTR